MNQINEIVSKMCDKYLLRESLEFDSAILQRLNPSSIQLPVDPTLNGRDAIGKLHVTLISGQALKPIKKELAKVWEEIKMMLPPEPTPSFGTKLETAVREDKITDFLVVENQEEYKQFVETLTQAIKTKIPTFVNINNNRFFHISVANNRGGNSSGSIGDINASDLGNNN